MSIVVIYLFIIITISQLQCSQVSLYLISQQLAASPHEANAHELYVSPVINNKTQSGAVNTTQISSLNDCSRHTIANRHATTGTVQHKAKNSRRPNAQSMKPWASNRTQSCSVAAQSVTVETVTVGAQRLDGRMCDSSWESMLCSKRIEDPRQTCYIVTYILTL